MSRRLDWIRRQTTAEDLLDDRVENFSDLPRLAETPDATVSPSPDAKAVQRVTLVRIRLEKKLQERALGRRALSLVGVLLGAASLIAGTLLAAFPVNMLVFHARTRGFWPTIEHVTPERSIIYGCALAVVGIALLYYSLHWPRRGSGA